MNKKTRKIVFVGLYIALAVVLQYVSGLIPFLQMPNGGNIDLGVIPVLMASYQFGYKTGIFTGLLCWLINLVLGISGSWFVSIPQYLFDYILPVSLLGLASAFPKIGKINNIYTGITGAMILKYLSHVLSGVYYWFPETTYGGSLASWLFSLNYNLYYNLATLIVALIVVVAIISKLDKNNEFKAVKK